MWQAVVKRFHTCRKGNSSGPLSRSYRCRSRVEAGRAGTQGYFPLFRKVAFKEVGEPPLLPQAL